MFELNNLLVKQKRPLATNIKNYGIKGIFRFDIYYYILTKCISTQIIDWK